MLQYRIYETTWGMLAIALSMIFTSSMVCEAQQFAGGRSYSRPTSGRMSVIEVAPTKPSETEKSSIITIVGAVKRSGVYKTTGTFICLKELVDTAGGLTKNASPSMRVIRNGSIIQQLYYTEQCTDDLKAGDIVVVVAKPRAFGDKVVKSDSIPVACIGLENRPVVISLDTSIATVEVLINKLRQHSTVAESTVVLDPLGRRYQSKLVPGSVIFFNPTQLDLGTLAQVKEHAPFDELLPMTPPAPVADPALQREADAKVSHTLPALPVNVVAEVLPQHLTGEMTNQSNPPLMVPNQQSPTIPSPDQQTVEALQLPIPDAQVRNDSGETNGLTAPTPIFNEPASVVTVEAPTEHSDAAALLPSQSTNAEQPRSDLSLIAEEERSAQTVGYQTESSGNANYEPEPTLASPPEVQDVEPTLADSPAEMASTQNPVTRISETAPLPPVERDANQQASVISEAGRFAAIETPTTSRSGTASWIPVAVGVGVLAFLCLGVSLLWSRYERHQTRSMFSDNETTDEVMESQNTAPKSPVEEILHSSLPMIEEQVIVPNNIPLHGEAVGHRRIIMHEKHSTVSGPHFNRKPQRHEAEPVMAATKFDERELRDSIKAAIHNDTNEHSASMSHFEDVSDQEISDSNTEQTSLVMTPQLNKSEEPAFTAPPHTAPPRTYRTDSCDVGTTSESHVNVSAPKVAAKTTEFDIVQPQAKRSENVGPLERALKALSAEDQQ